MNLAFPDLSADDLRQVASAIRSGRLLAPYTNVAVSRLLSAPLVGSTSDELQRLANQGFEPDKLATLLDLLTADRASRRSVEDVIDLVTTGPEADGVANRDTSVVVRELFANAEQSVLIAGYAVYQGQSVFRALADRMAERPTLRVRMFLDVQRPHGDSSASSQLARRFSARFVADQWPATAPLPEVFYCARSLDLNASHRVSLHAKCVVVDDRAAFVSSANFTEAAHERNIEVGILVRSMMIARRLVAHFEFLVAQGELRPLSLSRET